MKQKPEWKDMVQQVQSYIKQEWVSPPSPSAPVSKASLSPQAQEMEKLREECAGCRKCPLYQTATNLVFGVGSPDATLVFVGEAPGADEDAQGIPFVGRAGKLLTQTLEQSGSSRSEVYIGNVLKHRPPNNRDPNPTEIALCSPWLHRQLNIMKPKIIVTLGNFSTKLLLNTETGITKLRGQVHKSPLGFDIFPTLHPAAVLRNMNNLPDFQRDIRKAVEISRSNS